VPKHPPPHFQAAYPAINVLSQSRIIKDYNNNYLKIMPWGSKQPVHGVCMEIHPGPNVFWALRSWIRQILPRKRMEIKA
jgi:hypothetical protein